MIRCLSLYPASIKPRVIQSLNAIMKDYSQILQNLKLYLEYLKQDSTCNPKVVKWVEKEIYKIEQRTS